MEFLDLLQSTIENSDFRRVVATGSFCQLVLMSLKPGEGLEDEQLSNDKIFVALRGKAEIKFSDGGGELKEGRATLVAAEAKYQLMNNSEQEVKLAVFYAPPVFRDDEVDGTAISAIVHEPT